MSDRLPILRIDKRKAKFHAAPLKLPTKSLSRLVNGALNRGNPFCKVNSI
jgi:hypothetical protein